MANWVEIDDRWVEKPVGNNDQVAIEVGDKFWYYPSNNRYIEARVNALPYTDESNLTLFKDISI